MESSFLTQVVVVLLLASPVGWPCHLLRKSGQYLLRIPGSQCRLVREDVKLYLVTEGANVVSEMQVKPYNVYVTVAYPPDTDTPGFAEENKTKVSIPLCHVLSL